MLVCLEGREPLPEGLGLGPTGVPPGQLLRSLAATLDAQAPAALGRFCAEAPKRPDLDPPRDGWVAVRLEHAAVELERLKLGIQGGGEAMAWSAR